MRQTVKNQQSVDNKTSEALSKQVHTLNSQLKQFHPESVADSLAGIYNRKAFDRQISELVKKIAPPNHPFPC